ncbi:MAG: hypothetical protein HPY54_16855 [Chthonomonadetes bacterium]|nr:hypothetical protein [Chthonomonadetes bacterium]
MSGTSGKNIAILLLVGLVLIGVALFLCRQAQREEPPPPGYYTGYMLPKSQRMGPPGGGTPAPSTGGGQVTR